MKEVNVQSIWMSEEDASIILTDVLKSHKKHKLIGADKLFTLKAEINKRIKKSETKSAKAMWLLLKAPIEDVLEYIDDDYYHPIILWRMGNKIPVLKNL